MKPLGILMLIAAVAGSVHGQAFEVASIRQTPPDASGVNRRISVETNPGSLIMRNATLRSVIRWAYSVQDFQIVGGPEWRDSARYDIVARSAMPSSVGEMRLMLRTLLADRFQLVARMQTQEMAVYVLRVDKNGHRLRPGSLDRPREVQPDSSGLAFRNATMSDLQLFLSTVPGRDRPIVNQTGLDGAFDFSLVLLNGPEGTPDGLKNSIVSGGIIGFADALSRVGLRLEPQRLSLDVISIDKAERPSEN